MFEGQEYNRVAMSNVRRNGLALRSIPNNERVYPVCFAAVQQNGLALEFVPKDMCIPELCLAAVQQEGLALIFVPEDKCTPKLFLVAVRQYGQALEYVPEDKRTLGLCQAAVQQDGCALKYVPKENRSPELYLEAIQNDPIALQFIPEDQRTPELCRMAVQSYGFTLLYVPEDKKTPELCLLAVQNYGCALRSIPEDKRTAELCLAAVQQDGNVLADVPEEKQTPGVCLAAIEQNWLVVDDVPIEKRTPEIYLAVIQKNGLYLEQVPMSKRTPELCEAAVQQTKFALKYVPEEECTPKLYLALVEKDGLNLKDVPEAKCTPVIYLAAVRQNGLALQYVPEAFKEHIIQELSIATILKNNYLSCRYFPKHIDFFDSIMDFLRSIEYVVVANSSDSSDEYEVRDAYLTYIQNKQNKNKAVFSIASNHPIEELNKLVEDLSKAKNPKLHLVLIGHASVNTKELAGLTINDMVNLCESNKNIQHIHLLGCNTAKAKQPQAEREMLKKLDEYKRKPYHYGLMTTVNQSKTVDFRRKCLKYCQNNELDGVYVINKNEENRYELFSMKYDEQEQRIVEKVRDIPEKHISVQLLKGGGQRVLLDNWEMTFNKKQALPIRGKDRPLTSEELSRIRSLVDTVERFEKGHPKYKKDKTMYPFLSKIAAVVEDLEPSLLKRLADKLISNERITQSITLYGPTKAMHVDTARKNFKVARTHLYTSDYSSSLFSSGKPNIDYEKLKDERKQEIKQESKETKAKQLKVTIKPKSPI